MESKINVDRNGVNQAEVNGSEAQTALHAVNPVPTVEPGDPPVVKTRFAAALIKKGFTRQEFTQGSRLSRKTVNRLFTENGHFLCQTRRMAIAFTEAKNDDLFPSQKYKTKLQQLLEEGDYTCRYVASELKIDLSQLYGVAAGTRRFFGCAKRNLLADVYDCSVDELFGHLPPVVVKPLYLRARRDRLVTPLLRVIRKERLTVQVLASKEVSRDAVRDAVLRSIYPCKRMRLYLAQRVRVREDLLWPESFKQQLRKRGYRLRERE